MLRKIVSACGTQNMNATKHNSPCKCTAGKCAGAGLSGSRRKRIKIENKNIHARYADELATVIKIRNSGAGPHGIYVSKLFWFKQAHSFLRGICISRTSESTKPLFSRNFSAFVV